jgi:hypothetical protein
MALKSMNNPKGHIQPQKNLPVKAVATKITKKKIDNHKDIVNEIKMPTNETI